MRSHLQDLGSGDYQAAFQLLSASYQAANPSWPADRAIADPGITIVSIGAPQASSGTATVPVDFYARDRHSSPGSDTQCREFTGTVAMVLESGSWRYDPAGSGLSAVVVASTDPNCPG